MIEPTVPIATPFNWRLGELQSKLRAGAILAEGFNTTKSKKTILSQFSSDFKMLVNEPETVYILSPTISISP